MTKAELVAENEALRKSLSREVAKRERLKRSSTSKIRQLTQSVNEALEQQTATSEILRVISQSPTNVTPVFQVIVEHARRLCDGVFANVVRLDGGLMHNMAHHGFSPEAEALLRQQFPMPPSQGMSGRAILARAVVHAEGASSGAEFGTSHDLARMEGFRSMVSVPMLQGGTPLGAITVARRRAGRFPERCVDGSRVLWGPAGRARVGEWRLCQGAPPPKFDQRPPESAWSPLATRRSCRLRSG